MMLMSLGRRTPARSWLFWHVVAAAAIVGLSAQLFFGEALPALRPARVPFFASFAIAYLAAAQLVLYLTRRQRRLSPVALLAILCSTVGLWSLFLVIAKVEAARPLVVLMPVLGAVSLSAALLLSGRALLAASLVVVVLLPAVQAIGGVARETLLLALDMGSKPTRSQATINTAFHTLKATFYDRYFDVCDAAGRHCDTPRTGGALELFDQGFLYATGEGRLHYIEDVPGASLVTRRLSTDVPLDTAAFIAGGANDRDVTIFRVMDILVRERGSRYELFAAHHHWDSARRCFTMRVSRLAGKSRALLAGQDPGPWQTVWDAEPCLPLKISNGGQKQFGGDGAGGRMLLLDEHTMLVTIGDQQWDGWNWDHAVSQDPESAYGKVMKLDLTTGKASVFASGLRNPEGFWRDEQGKLWATEHGPQGGDELNLLVEGGNYGWPRMTYGNEYGTQDWPLREPGADDDPSLIRPIYAWLPSIGVSNLISVRGERFDRWKGDYLILSFNRSLQRAHIRDDKVVVLEPIQVRGRNGRLRDIVETPDGRLVLLLDLGALAFLEPLDPGSADPRTLAARGETLFSACLQCHRVNDGSDHSVGPDLHAVIGRPVAGAPGFAYSEALRGHGGRWTKEALDAFLVDPQAFAPGTAMQIRGLQRAADRAALIAYLGRQAKD
jgi:cytochrome c2